MSSVVWQGMESAVESKMLGTQYKAGHQGLVLRMSKSTGSEWDSTVFKEAQHSGS